MRRNSIRVAIATQAKPRKPKKPRLDFPLFPHATGRWAKKVRGRFVYFGPWDEPDKALEKWLDQKDDLLAGRKPREATPRGVTVADGCDFYLDHVKTQVERGERSPRWFDDLYRTLTIMTAVVGKHWSIEGLRRDDFAKINERFWRTAGGKKKPKLGATKKAPRRASPITARNNVHRVKGMFNWLLKAGHIERLPAYGAEFDPPDKMVVDRHRDNQPTRYFDRRQVRALLRATKDKPRIRAAILLAINVGSQNEDIATLQSKHLDLTGGWYVQPRSKKAKKRRAKLWPRTVRALKAILKGRQAGGDDLVFITKIGGAWHGRNCLAKEFNRVKTLADISIKGAGFQWLRHSFITEANQTGDLLAVQLACGHADRSITENYVHRLHDPRLVAIANAVDVWLVGKGGAE